MECDSRARYINRSDQVEVFNNENSPVSLDVWTMATLPNGSAYGPIINASVTLAPNSSPDRDRTQAVPATAPAGNYTYDGYAGIFPSVVWAEDHFDFSKLTAGDGRNGKDWYNWGESFDDLAGGAVSVQPQNFASLNASPNPFNPETRISFNLGKNEYISLIVYDILGKEAARLFEGFSSSGTQEFLFDGSNLSSGIYFVKLSSSKMNLTEKVLLVK